MQTCPCPRCGAALALSLASLHGVRCRSCGYEGPPRPEVLERLRIAQGELSRLDQRTRQLDASAQAAIGRALRTRWGAIVVLSLGVLPFVALAVAGVAEGFEAHPGLPLANRIIGVSLTWVPLLVYACVGGILAAFVGRARRRLLAASAAIPPERPGEPVTCAVCGASLASFGTSPIARCGYCAADNVVHPAALRQAGIRCMKGRPSAEGRGVARCARARGNAAAATFSGEAGWRWGRSLRRARSGRARHG
jgi:DNA-directed RNA polymerase subunit RPC12/RpoP